jgi:hypothetical protein
MAPPGLTIGLDGYYKNARDQIDDGQFGAAVVLTQFTQRQFQRLCEFLLQHHRGQRRRSQFPARDALCSDQHRHQPRLPLVARRTARAERSGMSVYCFRFILLRSRSTPGAANIGRKIMKREKWLVAFLLSAVFALGTSRLHAASIIDEWASIKAPPPPALKEVTADPQEHRAHPGRFRAADL